MVDAQHGPLVTIALISFSLPWIDFLKFYPEFDTLAEIGWVTGRRRL